jgi:uncharacterized RDD family membrane protein YckC
MRGSEPKRMVYCWKCGSELQSNVSYCAKCGSPVQPAYATTTNVTGSTGLDQLTANRDVQDLWLRRAVAFIIDSVIIGIGSIILALVFTIPLFIVGPSLFRFDFWGVWFWGFIPVLLVGYFILAEAGWGRTICKEAMGLKAVRVDGRPMDLGSSFLRNISKINWLLLLLDVIAGLVMHGDGRQKFSDRLAGTTVESVRVSAQILR